MPDNPQPRDLAVQLLDARATQRPIAAPELSQGGISYRTQNAYVVERMARGGGKVIGFKIGATSEKARAYLGVKDSFIGRMFEDRVFESPAVIGPEHCTFRLIEPEFAFKLGKDFPMRGDLYSEEEVAEGVACLYPAIEIVTSAYGKDWTSAGAPALIADNGVHSAFVRGEAVTDWRRFDLPNHRVELFINGERRGEGVGANALGGPITALTWIVNFMLQENRGMAAGEIVTTGVVTPFEYVEAGDEVVADFGEIGRVSVRFT